MASKPSAPPSRRASAGKPSPVPASRSTLIVRLQILGAVAVPLLLLGLWLASKGFFQPV